MSSSLPALSRILWRGCTLSESQAGGPDHWLELRLLAAAAVIFGHSYALKAGPDENDFLAHLAWGPGIYTGSLAVLCFFFISGFLVTGSWQRQQGLWRFLRARLARILPAYWVLLLLTVLLLGPLYTSLPLADYLREPGTWDYLLGNVQYRPQWTLPGVFEHNPDAGVINGSLWTLRPEVLAYLGLAALGLCGVLRGPVRFLLVAPLLLAGVLRYGPYFFDAEHQRVLLMFGLGCACWMLRDYVRLSASFLLVAVGLAWLLNDTACGPWALLVAIAYSCLCLAYLPWGRARIRARLPGDYSYGLYLWGYPIQQVVVFHTGTDSVAMVCGLGLLGAGVLAIASWHWVELPALHRFRPTPPSQRGHQQP